MTRMDLTGDAAPPTANGEIVFEAPWQSRVFGMARALSEQGVFTWDEFREKLIQQISDNTDEGEYHYFDHFLEALTRLLTERQLCREEDLSALAGTYAQRPHGHDHAHSHEH